MPPRRRNGYAAQYDLKTRAPVVISNQPPLNTQYISKDARPAISSGRYIRDPKYSESDEDLDYKGYDPDAPKKKKHYVYVNDLDEYEKLCKPDEPGPSTHNELAQPSQPAPSAQPDPFTGYDPNNQTNFFFGSSTEGSNASVTSGSQASGTSERSFSSSGSHRLTRSISAMSTLTNISELSTSYQASMASKVTPEGPSNTFPNTPAAPKDSGHTALPSSKGRNLNRYDAGSARIPASAKGKWVADADKPSRVIHKTVSGALVKNRAIKEDKKLNKGEFLVQALAAFDRGDGELFLGRYEKMVAGGQKMSPTSFKRGLARLSSNHSRSDTSLDYGRSAIERHMPNEFPGHFSSGSGNEQDDIESLYLGSSAANSSNQYHRRDLQSGSAAGENGSRYTERSKSPGAASSATLRQDSSALRRSASPPAMGLQSYRSRSRRVSSNIIRRSNSPPAMDLLGYGTRRRRSIKALSIPAGRPVPLEDFSYRRLATPSTALSLWDSDGDEDAVDAIYASPPPEKAPAGSGTHQPGSDHDAQFHRSVSDDEVTDNDCDAYTIDEDFHGNRDSAAGGHRSKPVPKLAIRRSQSEGTSLAAASRFHHAS